LYLLVVFIWSRPTVSLSTSLLHITPYHESFHFQASVDAWAGVVLFGRKIANIKYVERNAIESFNQNSGVTTMGSDRENPGAAQPQWAKWGPPTLGDRAKTLARASDMLQCRFLTSKFCKISPQSPGNGISESVDSKIFRMNMPWTP
jgi:hypothetical protein